LGRELIRVVQLGTFWGGYGAVEERVVCCLHPGVEPFAQLFEDIGE
jgi:hypothetical protein